MWRIAALGAVDSPGCESDGFYMRTVAVRPLAVPLGRYIILVLARGCPRDPRTGSSCA